MTIHIKTNEEILKSFYLKGKITEQHAKDILAILSTQREADQRAAMKLNEIISALQEENGGQEEPCINEDKVGFCQKCFTTHHGKEEKSSYNDLAQGYDKRYESGYEQGKKNERARLLECWKKYSTAGFVAELYGK